ncbi:hypothetical protein Rs2_25309 [Raphanus sativus]|nr:hypothetical protein Rs2_25309 [Raphanus sativus]
MEKYEDYLKLKSRVEILQHSQRYIALFITHVNAYSMSLYTYNSSDFRHLLGEEIAGMAVDELEQLQHQVDTSLRQIRSTKPALPNGQVDLLDFINCSGVEYLNQSSSHSLSNALKKGYRES